MTASRDPDRLIRAFIGEGEEELMDQVYDAVRAEIERRPQRAGFGPWRTPIMNKIVTFGLVAAAVVAAVFIGVQLFGSPDGGLGSQATPTPEPTPETTPSSSSDAGLPVGPFLVEQEVSDVVLTVTVPAPGWSFHSDFLFLYKGDADDTGILLWPEASGQTFYVPGDPCRWQASPDTPVTTADEFAAALAAQASRDASAPVDVMIDGYSGKTITLHVPADADFTTCDEATFVSWGLSETEVSRSQQEPGQIDEIWILDVEGSVVILDASYFPDTPAELVGEIRAIAESATFEVP